MCAVPLEANAGPPSTGERRAPQPPPAPAPAGARSPMPRARWPVRLAIDRESPDLPAVEQAVCTELAAVDAGPEVCNQVLVAILEAVANALRHGRTLDGAGRPVLLDLEVSDGRITATVTDDGPGFDLAACPDPRAPERLLLPGGRGLLLMRHYMDSVNHAFPPGGGTVVTLRRSVPAAGPEAEDPRRREDRG